MEAEVFGRKDELEAVEAFLDAATPTPSALIFEGRPGIGKTTLWSWGVDRAREAGYHVLESRPAEAEAAIPFAALHDLLGPALDDVAGEVEPVPRRALETALAVIESEEAVDRLAIFRGGLAVFRALGARDPLVLAIDDVQWLDRPTARVLEFSARRLADAPIRFLLAGREDGAAGPPLGLDRALPRGRVAAWRVGSLPVSELGGVVRAALGLELPRRRLVELHRLTGGNPLYAVEIVRLAAESGSDDGFAVPDSLAALLRERLGQLSDRSRWAVLLAAASAQPSTHLIERAAQGYDGLSEAIDRSIVQLDGERLRFSHPLLASVAYNSAPPWERREAHERLAEVVTDAEEGALHLALATEQPDARVAALLDEAADRTFRRGAPSSAAELSTHACALTPGDRPEELLLRRERCAEYHLAAGDTARGRALLEEVVEACAAGSRRAEALVRLGRVRYLADDVPAAHHLYEQALSEAGEDIRVATEAELGLAFTAGFGGDIAGAVEHARSALRRAGELDEPGLLALALSRVALCTFVAGEGVDRARLEQAIALEQDVGEVPVEWLPSYQYANIALYADDTESARRLYTDLHQRILDRNDERAAATLLFSLGQLECAAGNLAIAARHASEAVGRSREIGLAALQANALSVHALVCARLGRIGAARAAVEEGLALASRTGAAAPFVWLTAALGFLELSLGDWAAAHAALGPLTRMVETIGVGEPGVVRFLPDEIEALVALGELEPAGRIARLLEERGRALDRPYALATGARSSALVVAAEGDFDAARAAIARALEAHSRLADPFALGRTLLVQGQIARRARRRGAAREALVRALELFDSLGAALWAERAATELGRIPGRTRGAGELTPTERRTAELVCQGLSNKEVAAALFVTVRTVEANLSKVYAKLGIRSRTELVRQLAQEPARPQA